MGTRSARASEIGTGSARRGQGQVRPRLVLGAQGVGVLVARIYWAAGV
jgi:hypothetical protein